MTRSPLLAVLSLVACGAIGMVRADEADPPGRVARLSVAEGSVSLLPSGVPDWIPAELNRPLTTGDKLWTDQKSRAELDIGAAAIRLGPTTGFAFLNLDDRTAQLQLTAGTLIVRVRDMQANQVYEIDTPNLALTVQEPGEYRLEVNDPGNVTVVKVDEGAALAAGGGQTIAIGAQQIVRFRGTDALTYDGGTLGAPDELDDWSAARERLEQDSASRRYVAEEVPGRQDLDNDGTWQNTPDYGYVWTPTVIVANWVPYRFGHWVWIGPWGWTWVDAAPWGYLPFHYGRWIRYNNAWCWVPGPPRVQPLYAPALVGWVGGSSLGGSAVSGANVGWFPLAPREVYVPAHRASSSYLRRVNIGNIYQNQLTNTHYANQGVAAVTAVPRSVFTSGQRVGGQTVALTTAALAAATVTAAAPPITPSRESVLASTPGRAAARPPAALMNRSAVAQKLPPPALPSFAEQQVAIEAHGGRPLTRGELTRLHPVTPAAHVHPVAAGPVVPATALSHFADRIGAQTSLAGSEHLLPSNRPSATAQASAVPPLGSTPTRPAVPQYRNDRPPFAQQTQPASAATPSYEAPPAQPPPEGYRATVPGASVSAQKTQTQTAAPKPSSSSARPKPSSTSHAEDYPTSTPSLKH